MDVLQCQITVVYCLDLIGHRIARLIDVFLIYYSLRQRNVCIRFFKFRLIGSISNSIGRLIFAILTF